jgi:hypothetical protein
MFKGAVTFVAQITGDGVSFPKFEYSPNEPGVDKVEIEGVGGKEIRSTVHLASVATEVEGRDLALKVNSAALNRIAYFHPVTIEIARKTGDQFSPLAAQPGVHQVACSVNLFIAGAMHAVVGIDAAQLKTKLEQASPPGEHNFGFFRSARQSSSRVEEFMHLYNVLLMLFNDRQADVDSFIVGEDSTVPQTQHPKKVAGVMETVYTRLRNEMAHRRPGVDIDATKAEMSGRLGGLITLTQRAIELRP